MMWEIVAWAGGIALGWSFGYYQGEVRGIRDTERRWSEAVTRKVDRYLQTAHVPYSTSGMRSW